MKICKSILIFIIILSVSVISFSASSQMPSMSITSTNNSNSNSNTFLSVSSSSVNLSTEFYIILNLNKIDYNKFSVDITNDMLISADKVEQNVLNMQTSKASTTFTVNKDDISLDKIAIVYTSPNTDGNVKFTVKLKNLEVDEVTLKNEIEVLNKNITTLNESISKLQTSSSVVENTVITTNSVVSTNEVSTNEVNTNEVNEISNTVIDNTAGSIDNSSQITELENKLKEVTESRDNKQKLLDNISKEESITVNVSSTQSSDKEFDELEDKENMMANKDMLSMKDKMLEMQNKMTGLEGDLDSANKTISSLSNTVSYQGSGNNYLSTLSINGVEFKNSFNKTSQTYFGNVDSTVNSVTVNAKAEDSNSIVTIYGNTALKSGLNKIIVNVTSQDSAVRTYKIYISK